MIKIEWKIELTDRIAEYVKRDGEAQKGGESHGSR